MITSKILYDSIINSVKIPLQIWILVILLVLISLVISLIKLFRLAKSNMFEIDKMSGEEFEKYLEILFRNDGYIVTHVGSSNKYKGDLGADLIIEMNGIKTAVQAKRWNNIVTERAVQEVVASKAYYGCTQAMVITNNRFSQHAKVLAKINNVLLWDREKFVSEVLRIKNQNQKK